MPSMVMRIAGGCVLAICLLTGVPATAVEVSGQGLAAVPEAATGPGSTVWKRQFKGSTGSGYDAVSAVVTDHEANIVLGGYTGACNPVFCYPVTSWIAKHDPDGHRLWRSELGAGGSAGPVGTDRAGNVVSAGSFTKSDDTGLWFAKHSPAGELLWTREMRTGEGYCDRPSGTATDAAGNVLISAATYCCFPYKGTFIIGAGFAWVAKYSPAGEPLWWRRIGDWAHSYTTGILADANGNAFVSGSAADSGSNASWWVSWLIQMSPSGDLMWWRIPDADFAAVGLSLRLIGLDPLANIVGAVGGYIDGQWSSNWVGKYSSTGEPLSLRPLPDTRGPAVAVDGDGNILVSELAPDQAHYSVAKYTADAAFLWRRTFAPTVHIGYYDDVTSDKDGNVVVAGIKRIGSSFEHRDFIWLTKLRP